MNWESETDAWFVKRDGHTIGEVLASHGGGQTVFDAYYFRPGQRQGKGHGPTECGRFLSLQEAQWAVERRIEGILR